MWPSRTTNHEPVGAVEALTHPSKAVQRLLKMATTWLAEPPMLPTATAKYRTVRQLKPAEILQMVANARAGATVRQLAAKFGVHRSTVGKHLDAHGVSTRRLRLTPEQIEEAARLYREGASLEDLEIQYGVSDTTVRIHLLRYGMTMRRGGRTGRDTMAQRPSY